MALHKVSLRMATDASWVRRAKWSNTFYLDTPNPGAAAAAIAGGWIAHLATCVRNTVFAYEVYATSATPGDNLFSTVPIPLAQRRGTLSTVDLGEQYQFNACIGVELNVVNSRPSRKFWRPGIYEGDVVQGVSLGAGLVNATTNSFTALVAALDLLDPDGENIDSVGEIRLTSRKLGRQAGNDIPQQPPFG